MPRLRQISRDETTDELVLSMYDRLFGDRDPVAEPGTASGTPGDWWTVFALVPDVLKHSVRGFALYGSPKRRLKKYRGTRARPISRRSRRACASSVRAGVEFALAAPIRRELEVGQHVYA